MWLPTAMQFVEPRIVPACDDVELELLDMHAARLEAKLGGLLMKALAAAAPLAGLQHVKRVRKSAAVPGKLEVLLCPMAGSASTGKSDGAGAAAAVAGEQDGAGAGPTGSADIEEKSQGSSERLPPTVAALVQQHGLELFRAQVSRHAPRTREQAQEWGQQWPLSWRPPDPAAHPQNAELPEGEAAAMRRHMQRAWELAQGAAERGGVANACLIVDPRSGRVVAEAADDRGKHPLHHAAMQAVAAVAEWQLATWPGAGAKHAQHGSGAQQQQALPPDALDSKRRRLEGAADVQASSAAAAAQEGGQQLEEQQAQHRAQQADMSGSGPQPMQLCGGAAAGELPSTAAQPAAAANSEGPAPHAALAAAAPARAEEEEAAAAGMREGDPGPRPYLCTGFDCYLVHEPCIMCAMALVHSRLRRVVFCVPDAQGGALGGGGGGGAKLHACKSLNHHYHVYHLPLLGAGPTAV